jgi:hypothetical protein
VNALRCAVGFSISAECVLPCRENIPVISEIAGTDTTVRSNPRKLGRAYRGLTRRPPTSPRRWSCCSPSVQRQWCGIDSGHVFVGSLGNSRCDAVGDVDGRQGGAGRRRSAAGAVLVAHLRRRAWRSLERYPLGRERPRVGVGPSKALRCWLVPPLPDRQPDREVLSVC